MNNNVVFLGLLFILASNGTITATQTFLLLALLATTQECKIPSPDNCGCNK